MCRPLISLRYPSNVSATTGNTHADSASGLWLSTHPTIPRWHEPTAWVFEIGYWRMQRPALSYPVRRGHLAISIQREHRRRARNRGVGVPARQDCRNPGPNRPSPRSQSPAALDEGNQTHLHARDVGDEVPSPGPSPEGNAVCTSSLLRSGSPGRPSWPRASRRLHLTRSSAVLGYRPEIATENDISGVISWIRLSAR